MSTKRSKNYGGYLYATSYGGLQSLSTHMYYINGKMMYGGFKKEPYQFMSGTKIVVAANKREFGAIIDDGKMAMSFEVYKILCEELYNRKANENSFAHALFKMEWNLMTRSYNCVNMYVQHIQWRSDILISFRSSKIVNQNIRPLLDVLHIHIDTVFASSPHQD